MRRPASGGGWIFPASTRSGHIELSSLKKQHAMGGHMDPYSLAYFAGHSSFVTTRRYVHPNLAIAREAMNRARMAQGGHKIGHSEADTRSEGRAETSANY